MRYAAKATRDQIVRDALEQKKLYIFGKINNRLAEGSNHDRSKTKSNAQSQLTFIQDTNAASSRE